jgi:hypothetical protein
MLSKPHVNRIGGVMVRVLVNNLVYTKTYFVFTWDFSYTFHQSNSHCPVFI